MLITKQAKHNSCIAFCQGKPAWLFDLSNGSGFHLRILFLDAEPDWIQYPPDITPDAWTKSS